MFLWVRLVMSTLHDVLSETDIQDVIRDLPDELDDLYSLLATYDAFTKLTMS